MPTISIVLLKFNELKYQHFSRKVAKENHYKGCTHQRTKYIHMAGLDSPDTQQSRNEVKMRAKFEKK